jgi:hypothetical protein
MAVMPHRDADRALAQALALDIPFWPQLPHLSYREDMYAQASEHFPGIVLDMDARTLRFARERFAAELEAALARFDDPSFFDISPSFSAVYERFLALDLADRPAIRGQIEGPISFGFNVLDDDERPILFDDTVRPLLFEFMAKRVNTQLARLKAINPNAFMFIDEPGLQFLFSALAGYGDARAKGDYADFLALIDRPRGVHLCGNPDWDFLLGLDLDVLSLDIYSNGEVFSSYAAGIRRFLERGGVLVWGLVPTNSEPFALETVASLAQRFETIFETLGRRGIDRQRLLAQGLLSPATCCLVNPDRERTVEAAFAVLQQVSRRLRAQWGLAPPESGTGERP